MTHTAFIDMSQFKLYYMFLFQDYGLYYDGNTGCYYNYNQQKNCYEFHSQVQVQSTTKTTSVSFSRSYFY